MPSPTKASRLKKFWQERVVALVIAQLKQGITPEKISLTIALGMCIAVFPILATTTLLCLIVGMSLKLNQPILQLVNWLTYALQFPTIPLFIRFGEWLVRAPHVSFSIPDLMHQFRASPVKFFREFGMTCVHGIIGWLVVAPFLVTLLYFIFLPMLKKLSATLKERR